MIDGYFSIVLHAHLPYVRHREAERLEERWLFEAITETYIPLLWVLEEQQQTRAMTISFSPPLMEMLADPLMQRRYLQSIEEVETLLEKEAKRAENDEEKAIVDFYTERYQKIKHTFLKWDQKILEAFRHYAETDKIVCITSAATHAFLPYIQTQEGLRTQIIHGVESFKKYFGKQPRGFWLPECAFTSGIDKVLHEAGIQYTFVDEHAIESADPKPSKGTGAPIYSPHGIALFPRNSELSSQVWSSVNGYPGDHDYREFYRDIAYQRDWEYIMPFMHSTGIRFDTGLKYNRITGQTEEKDLYNRSYALNKVQQHAQHFASRIIEQLEQKKDQCYPPAIFVTPFDAELFGHWWFEGPDWIGALLNEGKDRVQFLTPEEFVDRHYRDLDTAHVSFNTWGRNGFGEVWLNEKNSWIYRHLHRIEKDLIHIVSEYIDQSEEVNRCLKQMVREWMLVSSSDWPFIIDGDSATQYAIGRIHEHMFRYEKLRELLLENQLNHQILTMFEAEYPFIEDVKLELLVSKHDQYILEKKANMPKSRKTILMLAWEYPPMMVGGLSRHVYDLSKQLVKDGHSVHVVTTHVHGYPDYEVNCGVHVYRVKSLQPNSPDFYDWVGCLNVAFANYARELAKGIDFDVIHAHDWLVTVSAKALKHELNIPLVATIHATEHGRNNGLFSDLQHRIHGKEWELTYEANKVIVCSDYMEQEAVKVFNLPKDKIEIIPNGVDISMIEKPESGIQKDPNNKMIFSVGRMVKEKGFQTIIEAAPSILARHNNVTFMIAGKGPMLEEFRATVRERGLEEHIKFLGFVDDETRNNLLHQCDICLFPSHYEPFGIVALEGMIAGKPTIVSETGGLGEIVTHDETGLKIYPANAESLATQVVRLLEDEALADKIARNGKDLAETKYSWETISNQTYNTYEDSLV